MEDASTSGMAATGADNNAGDHDLAAVLKKDLVQWSTDDVFTFMSHHAAEIANKFTTQAVTGKTILTWRKKEDIIEYGVQLGTASTLWDVVRQLLEEQRVRRVVEERRKRPASAESDWVKRYRSGLAPSNHTGRNCMDVQQSSDPPYLNGRPFRNVGLPLSLAHSSIGELFDMLKTVKPQRRDMHFAEKLAQSMSLFYRDEWARQSKLAPLLQSYYGMEVSSTRLSAGSSREADLFIGSLGNRPIFRMCIEIANEASSTPTVKYFQGAAYYRDFCVEFCETPVVKQTCVPMLLLEICGSMFRLSLCALLDKITQEPLTDYVNLLPYNQSGNFMELWRVAQIFKVTELWMKKQQWQYWNSARAAVVPERLPALTLPLPYPLGFPENPLSLCKRFGGSFSNIVNMRTDRSQVPIFSAVWSKNDVVQPVVNKYARKYPSDIHEALSEGAAEDVHVPKFLGSITFPGSWTSVLMEYLRPEDGWRVLAEIEPGSEGWDSVIQRLRIVITKLHSLEVGGKHIVVGDVRPANLAVHNSGQVKVLDLDWVGFEGEARYPKLLNHEDIYWAEGVTEGGLITRELDLKMVEILGEPQPVSYEWATDTAERLEIEADW